MKKKIIFFAIMTFALAFTIAITASAAVTGSASNEFGDVTEVEGVTSTITDTTSKVVLINADGTYTTYPTYYVVPKLTWQSEPSWNFDNLNAATGESYSIASIIRVQIPTDATKLLTNSGNKLASSTTLVEVNFPEGTQITELVWGAFAKCTALEKINIPSSITTISQDVFANCTSLKYVTIEDGVPYLGKQMFNTCTALERIVLPNSVKYVESGAFYSCTSLKEVVLGAGFEYFNGDSVFGLMNDFVIYMPETFYQSDEYDSKIVQYLFAASYHTSQTMKKYVIYYTGTYDDAIALKGKFASASNQMSNMNIVAYDATKETADYYNMSAYEDGANTSRVLVYGYNKCDAFYDSKHNIVQEEGNNCCGICSRCNELSLLENPEHTSEWSFTDLDGNTMNVSKDIKALYTCKFCKTVEATEEIATIILPLGYTQAEDGSDLAYRASVNRTALTRYEELSGNTVKYGMLAGIAIGDNGTPISVNEEGKVVAEPATVIVNLTGTDYTVLEIKITGINKTTSLYCNAYAVIGTDISYICETASDTATKKDITIA